MRKFIKLKFDCETTNKEKREEEQVVEEQKPVICLEKPPLPLYPPPLVNPTPVILTSIKKEIIEDQYEPSSPPSLEIKSELRMNQELQSNILVDKKEIFLRNNCTPPKKEIIEEQYEPSSPSNQTMGNHIKSDTELKINQEMQSNYTWPVYTFCKDFQNKNTMCKFPNCKYVHATVFEEGRFYRTGYLPPHALAHQKKNTRCNFPIRRYAHATAFEQGRFYRTGYSPRHALAYQKKPNPIANSNDRDRLLEIMIRVLVRLLQLSQALVPAHENHAQENYTAYPVSNILNENTLNAPFLNQSAGRTLTTMHLAPQSVNKTYRHCSMCHKYFERCMPC